MKVYSGMSDEDLVEEYTKVSGGNAEKILDLIMFRYHTLISSVAAPFFLAGAEREDLIQEGRIGLYDAVLSYDRSKNDTFAPFARMCIERAQIKAVARYSRKKNSPLNSSVSIDDDEETKSAVNAIYADTKVSDPEEIFFDLLEVREKINRLRDDLSPLEMNVLQYMMEGYDYRQIAKILGRSDKSIDNTMQRVRKKGRSIWQ